jgi:P27 family predicted phage terminase small subunit
MGSRGPAKKPSVLLGSDRDTRAFNPAGEFDIAPPEHLGDAGKAEWGITLLILQAMGVLTTADRPALISYCELHDRLSEYKTTLEADGELYALPNGCKAVHPAVRLREKCERAINDFRKAYGMTASARAAIGIQPAKGQSKLQLFSRKREPQIRNRHDASKPFNSCEEAQADELARQQQQPTRRAITEQDSNELYNTAFLSPDATPEEKANAHALLAERINQPAEKPRRLEARNRKTEAS